MSLRAPKDVRTAADALERYLFAFISRRILKPKVVSLSSRACVYFWMRIYSRFFDDVCDWEIAKFTGYSSLFSSECKAVKWNCDKHRTRDHWLLHILQRWLSRKLLNLDFFEIIEVFVTSVRHVECDKQPHKTMMSTDAIRCSNCHMMTASFQYVSAFILQLHYLPVFACAGIFLC